MSTRVSWSHWCCFGVRRMVAGCAPTPTASSRKSPSHLSCSRPRAEAVIFLRGRWRLALRKKNCCAGRSLSRTSRGAAARFAFAYTAGKKGDPYYIQTAVANFMTTPLQGPVASQLQELYAIANLAFRRVCCPRPLGL